MCPNGQCRSGTAMADNSIRPFSYSASSPILYFESYTRCRLLRSRTAPQLTNPLFGRSIVLLHLYFVVHGCYVLGVPSNGPRLLCRFLCVNRSCQPHDSIFVGVYMNAP